MQTNKYFSHVLLLSYLCAITAPPTQARPPRSSANITKESAQKILEDQLVYPQSEYEKIPYPPQAEWENRVYEELVRQQIILYSAANPTVRAGTGVEAMMQYPTYKLMGFKLMMCTIGIQVETVRRKGKEWLITGKKTVLSLSPLKKKLASAQFTEKSRICRNTKARWILKADLRSATEEQLP